VKKYGLEFHHLGLAVKKPDKARAFLAGLGYQIGPSVYDPLQEVNLLLCTSETSPDVELVYPTDREGPLSSILKYQDQLIYHLCYTSEDTEQSISAIESEGFRTLVAAPKKPAVLFGGLQVSFYLVSGFGLIELLEV